MPSSRKERVDKVVNNQVYKQFLIVEYAILKKVLGLNIGKDFCYTSLGKPYIDGAKNFSISHCEDILVIAVSNNKIGVDLEKIKEFNPKLAKKVLNDDEFEYICNSKDKNYQFAKLWTKKESFTKVFGKSVFDDTKNILKNAQNFTVVTKRKNGFVVTVCEIEK